MKKITKKTNLGELVKNYPQTGEILKKKYGLHCLGCFLAAFETLEQGAQAHGLTAEEIDQLVKKLNKRISQKPEK